MLGWNRVVTFTSKNDQEAPLTGVLARIDAKSMRDGTGSVVTQWTVEVSPWTRYASGALISAGDGMTWERFPGVPRDTTLGKPTPDLDSVGGTICFPFTEEN